jgi:hypothetical protein
MKRQVIQHFLNLPGISGVALIDGRNRPCFLGMDTSLNSHQQEALAQGIQQVVDTTPNDFDSFSFRFTSQLAHIYKLQQGLILLVITSDQLPLREYRPAVKQLQATLQEDLHNAVPNFRLMAGCVTLNHAASPPSPTGESSSAPEADSPKEISPPPSDINDQGITHADIVRALNHLSDFSVQYMGKIIVANMWRSSKPQEPWLERFEIQKSGHFQVNGGYSNEVLTPEQHQGVRDWVTGFINRCSRTIRDFPRLVADKGMPDSERILLLEDKSTR